MFPPNLSGVLSLTTPYFFKPYLTVYTYSILAIFVLNYTLKSQNSISTDAPLHPSATDGEADISTNHQKSSWFRATALRQEKSKKEGVVWGGEKGETLNGISRLDHRSACPCPCKTAAATIATDKSYFTRFVTTCSYTVATGQRTIELLGLVFYWVTMYRNYQSHRP